MFERFSPDDPEAETLQNAHEWLRIAKNFPERFQEQVRRIWERWEKNWEYVKGRYDGLPTSVFQANLNKTNILVDDEGNFKGVIDFNLAGRETLLNLLMREIPCIYGWFEEDEKQIAPDEKFLRVRRKCVARIKYALGVVKKEYSFSNAERELALPVFRCVSPPWSMNLEGDEPEDDIASYLDATENAQTEDIDFASAMR